MRDPGCDNDNVSPTPAQQAQAARIAAELSRPRLRPARHPRRPDDPLRPPRLPLPRRPAPPARPLPPVDPQERRQDRHPHPDRRPARRLPAPGSTTTAACANWSPNSKNSASPSPKPTPAGTASHTARRGHSPASPPEPEQQPPDSVGNARLTCGQPSSQTPFPQVSPKREDLTHSDLEFYRSRSFLMRPFCPHVCSMFARQSGPSPTGRSARPRRPLLMALHSVTSTGRPS